MSTKSLHVPVTYCEFAYGLDFDQQQCYSFTESVVPLATASCGLTVTSLLPSTKKKEVREAEPGHSAST